MANTELIVALVLAALALLSSAISLLFTLFYGRRSRKKADEGAIDLKKRFSEAISGRSEYSEAFSGRSEFEHQIQRKETVSTLRDKYGPPLLVAAYNLQARLYELVEYPISQQHLTTPEGLEDVKIFSCYLLAQYLAHAHILRTQTEYPSYSKADEKLQCMRKIMYMIDEELDRRRDGNGYNVGVWPAARILAGERMMAKTTKVNAALDGGLGVTVRGWDQFRGEFDDRFREPMAFFCERIDLMLEGRKTDVAHLDAPLRRLQHLLVDLVDPDEVEDLRCARSKTDCDCFGTKCMLKKKNYLKELAHADKQTKVKGMRLKARQDMRLEDQGLWATNSRTPKGQGSHDYAAAKDVDLTEVKKMTHYLDAV